MVPLSILLCLAGERSILMLLKIESTLYTIGEDMDVLEEEVTTCPSRLSFASFKIYKLMEEPRKSSWNRI